MRELRLQITATHARAPAPLRAPPPSARGPIGSLKTTLLSITMPPAPPSITQPLLRQSHSRPAPYRSPWALSSDDDPGSWLHPPRLLSVRFNHPAPILNSQQVLDEEEEGEPYKLRPAPALSLTFPLPKVTPPPSRERKFKIKCINWRVSSR
ncbi:hypothetical protein chiPu_0001239 [Chiloscyllium punctatum]|uniref:Uncharacterized protein n=1 Tax=Chiloscyllium punctatum TaxID=137246 RepID=A0A401RXM6_CHIPU|nr:hypothetical protein [Chiloscyllium punctatum]